METQEREPKAFSEAKAERRLEDGTSDRKGEERGGDRRVGELPPLNPANTREAGAKE